MGDFIFNVAIINPVIKYNLLQSQIASDNDWAINFFSFFMIHKSTPRKHSFIYSFSVWKEWNATYSGLNVSFALEIIVELFFVNSSVSLSVKITFLFICSIKEFFPSKLDFLGQFNSQCQILSISFFVNFNFCQPRRTTSWVALIRPHQSFIITFYSNMLIYFWSVKCHELLNDIMEFWFILFFYNQCI